MLELQSAAGPSVFAEAQTWEGQVLANGNFRLRRYLGGSDHSAVFLTDIGVGQIRPPAIKLIAADASMDIQLAQWKAIAKLGHPHLLQIFDSGRCQFNGEELLFVVYENADETLAEILRDRCLTPDEVREMLKPTLEALSYLHDNGQSAGRVSPSNIMAIGEQVKLASDIVSRTGSPPMHADQRRTDAIGSGGSALADRPLPIADRRFSPEAALEGFTPAGDIWALGMTIAEVLTQRVPQWNKNRLHDEPTLPDSLAEPFSDIVRHCLVRDPLRRWTISDIKSRLKQPVALPVSEQPRPGNARHRAAMAAKRANRWLHNLRPNAVENGLGKKTSSAPADQPSQISPASTAQLTLLAAKSLLQRHVYAIPIVAMLTAVLLLVNLLWHRSNPSISETRVSESSAPQPVAPEAKSPGQKRSRHQKTSPVQKPESRARAAVSRTGTENAVPASGEPSPELAKGIVHRAVPIVPEKALGTIHGRVRVSVKLSVDGLGNVARAEFASAGPSRYFADLALDAARDWKFTQGKVGRRWLVQFVFENSGVTVAEREL